MNSVQSQTVSVVMAAWQGMPYLKEQVHSILRELKEQDELIVSIDPAQNPDESESFLRSLCDPRIRILAGPGKGVIANFENGLRKAGNSIIFLSDQDDVWLSGKREKMLEAFEDEKVMCVVHDCSVVNESLQIQEPSFFRFHHSRPGLMNNLIRNSYIGCCMAFRKQALGKILPFPDHLPMHDQWIGLICQTMGKTVWLDSPLLLYRRHENNVSSLHHAPLSDQIAWRTVLAKALLSRTVRFRRR